MDLLGSILSSMDKPPTVGEKQRQLMKQQKELFTKQQAADKAKLNKFRGEIEEKINSFIQDSEQQKFRFDPMSKMKRSIVHDVADVAGLTAFSFGEEDIDRHVMLFKKEFAPSDDELLAYRKGKEWDPELAKELNKKKELAKKLDEEERNCKPSVIVPTGNYHEKYEKLLGKEAGKDAAKAATVNKQFGNVPSENKRDQRSIEQTLADIRAKKKLKSNHNTEMNEKDS